MTITTKWVAGALFEDVIAQLQATEDKAVAAEAKLAGIATGATNDAAELSAARAGNASLATRLAADKGVTDRRLNELFALARRPSYESVRLATTGPISLTELPLIDDEQTVQGDRILVKDQPDATENGIYIAGGNTWARASDLNQADEVTPRTLVAVREGSVNAQTVYELNVTLPVTIGTSSIVWARVAALPDAFIANTAANIAGTTPAIGTIGIKTDTGVPFFGDSAAEDGVDLARRDGVPFTVANMTALRALTGLQEGQLVYMRCHTVDGDGGGGIFRVGTDLGVHGSATITSGGSGLTRAANGATTWNEQVNLIDSDGGTTGGSCILMIEGGVVVQAYVVTHGSGFTGTVTPDWDDAGIGSGTPGIITFALGDNGAVVRSNDNTMEFVRVSIEETGQVSILHYGGGNPLLADHAPAMQGACDYARNHVTLTAAEYDGWTILVPTGIEYQFSSSINLTRIDNRNWSIDGGGVVKINHTGIGIDCLGSRFFTVRDLTIRGANHSAGVVSVGQSLPSVGLAFGRTAGESGASADVINLDGLSTFGCFAKAAVWENAAEDVVLTGLCRINNDIASDADDAVYGLAFDNSNLLGVTSAYAAPFASVASHNGLTVSGKLDIRRPNGGPCLMLARAAQVDLGTAYLASYNGAAAHFYADSNGIRGLHWHAHVETLAGSPSVEDMIRIKHMGSSTANIEGLRIVEHALHVSNSCFIADDTITTINMFDCHFSVYGEATGASYGGKMFDKAAGQTWNYQGSITYKDEDQLANSGTPTTFIGTVHCETASSARIKFTPPNCTGDAIIFGANGEMHVVGSPQFWSTLSVYGASGGEALVNAIRSNRANGGLAQFIGTLVTKQVAKIFFNIIDSTDGSEDVAVQVQACHAGTLQTEGTFKNGFYGPGATGAGQGANTINVGAYYLNGAAKWTSGAGSPEGVVTGPIGSLYSRTDGSIGTTLYIKESGTGNTGWVAK